MRRLVILLILAVSLISSPSVGMAQMQTLLVTVSYRERIALPPEAQLDIQVFDAKEAERRGRPIASQRFAMTSVPMTVSLNYDPQVVEVGSQYGVLATIRAPEGKQMFRATKMLGALDGSATAAVDMMVMMIAEGETASTVPSGISGVPWTATEVFGEAWQNNDPATLVVDDEMNFTIFGGCNRFVGRMVPMGTGLAFPANMAGTMMACPDDVELLERRFLAALKQVSDYVRYGAGLVLTDAEGRAVVHFAETPE